MKHSKSLLTALTLVITLLFSVNTTAQSKSQKKDFTILVEKTDDGVKMKCIRGCAWTELAFSLNGRGPQSVDQFGTFNTESKRQTVDPKLIDFEFSISRKNSTFVLNGLKGTNWQTLSLTSKSSQFFNKDGLLRAQ